MKIVVYTGFVGELTQIQMDYKWFSLKLPPDQLQVCCGNADILNVKFMPFG